MMTHLSISFRAVEFDDVSTILQWENNNLEWLYSGTVIPFSRYQIEQYVLNASSDFWASRQLRLMIDDGAGKTIGAIDLFDADPIHRRAGIGLMIDAQHRGKGYGQAALTLIKSTAFERLGLRQLWCNIAIDNKISLHLFQNAGYLNSGIRRDWILYNGQFHDVIFLQLLNPNR